MGTWLEGEVLLLMTTCQTQTPRRQIPHAAEMQPIAPQQHANQKRRAQPLPLQGTKSKWRGNTPFIETGFNILTWRRTPFTLCCNKALSS